MLFADDAVLASHTESGLQGLMDRLSHACKEFALTISIKKTNVMCQEVETPPSINNKTLNCVNIFTYLGSTISSDLSLNAELSIRLVKPAAAVMAKLSKRVWSNKNLTVPTNLQVYQACVISTLLYGRKRKLRAATLIPLPGPSPFVCANWRRDCHSRVGLYSHNRSCNKD